MVLLGENFVHGPTRADDAEILADEPAGAIGVPQLRIAISVAPQNPGVAIAGEIAGPSDLPATYDAEILADEPA